MLLDSEIQEIKVELGWHALTTSALPYVSWTALFEQVIQPNVSTLAETTSATAIAPAPPASTTITLASGTGFLSGQRIVIDVDDQQETVTASVVQGAQLTAIFKLTHAGTYPVAVECGQTKIRKALAQIRSTKTKLATTYGLGTLKRADDVEWYQSGGNMSTQFGVLADQLLYWRDELAAACGDISLNRWRRSARGGSGVAMY